MTQFTKEEIETEHMRRKKAAEQAVRDVRTHDAECLHCHRPFSTALASAGGHGLCDVCLHND